MLAFELRRAFSGAPFLLALAVGLCITVASTILVAGPFALSDGFVAWRSGANGGSPPSFFGAWIGMTPFDIATSVYYYALPLLACIPFAASSSTDMSSHFADQMLVRKGRARYFSSKAIAVFLTSGAVTIIPLLINIVVTACLLAQIAPEPTENTFAVMASSMLANLFYTSPWGYIALFLALTFLVAGIYGLLSVALSFFARNAFVVVLAPFALCVVVQLITQGTPLAGFAPLNVVMPAQPFPSIFWVVALLVGVSLLALIAFLSIRGTHYEDV